MPDTHAAETETRDLYARTVTVKHSRIRPELEQNNQEIAQGFHGSVEATHGIWFGLYEPMLHRSAPK